MFFFLIAVPKKVFLGAPWLCEAQPWHKYFEKRKKHQPPSTKSLGSSGFFRDFLEISGRCSFCFISQNLQDIQPMLWDLPIYLVPPPNSHNFESQEPNQEDLIIIKWCCPLQTAIEQICGHHHVLTGFWNLIVTFRDKIFGRIFAGVSKVSQRILLRLSFFGQAKGFFSLNHVITWHLWDRLLASHRSSTYWPPNLVQCHPVFRL